MRCADCERVNLEKSGRPGWVFIRCRSGYEDPYWANRVLDVEKERMVEVALRREAPVWCPRRKEEAKK